MEQGTLRTGRAADDRCWMPVIAVLPLLLVGAYLAHSRAVMLAPGLSVAGYLLQLGSLLFTLLPMLAAQYVLARRYYNGAGQEAGGSAARSQAGWLAGCVTVLAVLALLLYPLAVFMLPFGEGLLAPAHSGAEGSAILIAAALLWWLLAFIRGRAEAGEARRLPWLQNLDAMVLVAMLGWALLLAGVFNSLDEPMLNQPFELTLDLGNQLQHLGRLLGYLWQFWLMVLLLFIFYWLNRYLFIRQCLSRFGVFAFVVVSLLALMLLTPVFAALVIALPVNQLPPQVELMVPGGNTNPFDAHNYRFMFLLWLLSTPIILAFERQQQASRLAAIAQQQTQTELQLLQQQINPHFLFNTLNSLYALTLMKTEDAPERILQLAGLLRYSVYRGQQAEVSLSEEVDCLKDYLALQQIRQGARLSIDCDWPDAALIKLRLAPLLFIVLVENAFKHGLEPSQHQGWLKLGFWQQGTRLCFRCDNSLPPTEPEDGAEIPAIAPANSPAEVGGLGLANLARRLALLYPGGHKLISERRDDHWHAQLEIELGQASRPAD